jgi:regulator of nucleoside diphosphate kinase
MMVSQLAHVHGRIVPFPIPRDHSRPPIIVGRRDLERLRLVVDRHGCGRHAAAAAHLDAELDRAIVLPQRMVPPEIVTMNSRVLFEIVGMAGLRELVLVYPEEADAFSRHISVLTPVGTALLGLAAGECIDWPLVDGRPRTLRVDALLYQPEAAGREKAVSGLQ